MREQWDCPVRTGVEAHEAMHDALGPEPAP